MSPIPFHYDEVRRNRGQTARECRYNLVRRVETLFHDSNAYEPREVTMSRIRIMALATGLSMAAMLLLSATLLAQGPATRRVAVDPAVLVVGVVGVVPAEAGVVPVGDRVAADRVAADRVAGVSVVSAETRIWLSS